MQELVSEWELTKWLRAVDDRRHDRSEVRCRFKDSFVLSISAAVWQLLTSGVCCRGLYLDDNELSGSLPSTMGQMAALMFVRYTVHFRPRFGVLAVGWCSVYVAKVCGRYARFSLHICAAATLSSAVISFRAASLPRWNC
jgi:hypothetical protein